MKERRSPRNHRVSQTEDLKSSVRDLGIDLAGIADLRLLVGMPYGITFDSASLLERYSYAIVMGAQLGKLGNKASGKEMSLLMEKAATEVVSLLEKRGYRALTIHTEDEFDPIERMGFISLKVLAKGAGLGWQGRSLLIVSPQYGPIHRLVAVLTNMDLQADTPISNQCGDCSICIRKCPTGALTLVRFEDHPKSREDVLDIGVCLGDDGCKVCLVTCPWREKS
jgi:epoxyqueuosine reductase